MASTTSNTGVLVNLKAGDALFVSTTDEAFVDLVSGVTGAGYTSIRILRQYGRQIGPFSDAAVLRVRATSGTATYAAPKTPGSAIAAAVAGAFAQLRAVLVGDSTLLYGFDYNATSPSNPAVGKPYRATTNRSIIDKAIDRGRHKIRVEGRIATGGDTLKLIVDDRLERLVVPIDANCWILMAGGNDWDQGYSAQQVFDRLKIIHQRSQEEGKLLVFLNTTGRSRGNPTNNPSPDDGVQYQQSKEMPKFVGMCTAAQGFWPNFRFCDISEAVRDYGVAVTSTGSSNGAIIAGTMSSDNSHVTAFGGLMHSMAPLDKFLDGLSPTTSTRQGWNGYGANGPASGTLAGGNFLMMGEGGNVLGGNTGKISAPLVLNTGAGPIRVNSVMAEREPGKQGHKAVLTVTTPATSVKDNIVITAISSYNGPTGIDAFFQCDVVIPSVTAGGVYNVTGDMQFQDANSVTLGTVSFGKPHRDKSEGFAGLGNVPAWVGPSEGYVNNTGGATFTAGTGWSGPVDLGLCRTPRMAIPEGTTKIRTDVRLHTLPDSVLVAEFAEYGGWDEQGNLLVKGSM
jgi:hypothetical protein